MPRRKRTETDTELLNSSPPAFTIEERESQLISMAYNLAEKRILDGSASSAEVVHFLKLGSTKDRLERELMEKQNELLAAKAEAMKSQKRVEELYAGAIAAIRKYQGDRDDKDVF